MKKTEYEIILSLNASEAIPEVESLTKMINTSLAECGLRDSLYISTDLFSVGKLKVDRLLTPEEKKKVEEFMTAEWRKVLADKSIGDYSKHIIARLEMSREETAVSQ